MRLYLAHRYRVIDFFVAIRASIVFKVRNGVSLPLNFASPIPPNFFDFVAAARRANGNFYHGTVAFVLLPFNYKARLDEIRK